MFILCHELLYLCYLANFCNFLSPNVRDMIRTLDLRMISRGFNPCATKPKCLYHIFCSFLMSWIIIIMLFGHILQLFSPGVCDRIRTLDLRMISRGYSHCATNPQCLYYICSPFFLLNCRNYWLSLSCQANFCHKSKNFFFTRLFSLEITLRGTQFI